ncbi:hypothetical protein SGLAM104S_03628 [Streptomyces glaucescens]
MDIAETYVHVELFDLALNVLARAEEDMRPGESRPEQVVGHAAAAVGSVVAQAGVEGARVLGVGVSVPGQVDRDTGVAEYAPNWDWHDVPLLDLLTEHIAYPLHLDNPLRACAVAELWFGAARGRGDAVVVNLGTGVGAGLVLGGGLHRGVVAIYLSGAACGRCRRCSRRSATTWASSPSRRSPTPGAPAVYNGGWSMFVNAKGKNVEAAKEYVKWLWIDQKEYQEDWALSYGFHVPPRVSIAESADKLKSGLPAEGVRLFDEYGHFDNIGFTQAMTDAIEDVVADCVRSGGDPEAALDKADGKVERELKKLFG